MSQTSPASRWRLDPLPTVLAADDWATVARGVAQRAELLDRVLADLYGPRRLLTSGLLPPELVWRQGMYRRAAWGAHPADRRRVVLAAADLGRDADGSWRVTADRVQAPSGLGYAMENRRVVSRLLPDAYRRAELHLLMPVSQVFRHGHPAMKAMEVPQVPAWAEANKPRVAEFLAFLDRELGGGWGVMMDDMLAGLMAGIGVVLFRHFVPL